MELRRRLRTMVNTVLSTLKVHPETLQTTGNSKQAASLYTSRPAKICEQTIQSHLSITGLCKYQWK